MRKIIIRLDRPQQEKIERARCLLEDAGIPKNSIVEEASKPRGSSFLRTELTVFISSSGRAALLARRLRAGKPECCRILAAKLPAENWKTRWKKYLKPFKITKNVYIAPSWKKFRPPAGCQAILIDTTFAFGTGLHATTQMMAKLIAMRKGFFDSFLDVGTGSGILAILASRCGCRTVWAVDNDKQAVQTAAKNLKRNRCQPDFLGAVDINKLPGRKRFDFVAANLITDELIRSKTKLIRLVKPGGYLAVSGVYRDNLGRFRRAFRAKRLKCCLRLEKKKWQAFLFKLQ